MFIDLFNDIGESDSSNGRQCLQANNRPFVSTSFKLGQLEEAFYAQQCESQPFWTDFWWKIEEKSLTNLRHNDYYVDGINRWR